MQHQGGSRDISNPCNCFCFVCADSSARVIFQWMGAADPITKGGGLHWIWWPFQTAALVSLKVNHEKKIAPNWRKLFSQPSNSNPRGPN